MNQLNFNSERSQNVSFRNIENTQKKSSVRDYASLSRTRIAIDRLKDEKALARELKEFCFD